MNNFKILLTFTLISLGLAILFFIFPQIIAPIPYGTFTFSFAFLICFWMAVRLSRPREFISETQQSLVNTIKTYFWIMGAFFFFDGIAHIGIPALYPKDLLASHMHTFSHAFFFVGNAFLIRIPISFFSPRLKNYASGLMILLGVLTVAWRTVNTDKLVYIFGPTQPPIIITDQFSGILFLVTNTIALLLPGFYLLYLGFKSLEKTVRTRAIFLGLGMIIFFSIGPVINLVQNQYTQLLIHLLQALSFFLMGASVFYDKETLAGEENTGKNSNV